LEKGGKIIGMDAAERMLFGFCGRLGHSAKIVALLEKI
jgi:hypothetical protein